MLFKNLEKCTGEILKVDLTPTDLVIIKKVMDVANVQGKDVLLFAKTIEKIEKAILKCPPELPK